MVQEQSRCKRVYYETKTFIISSECNLNHVHVHCKPVKCVIYKDFIDDHVTYSQADIIWVIVILHVILLVLA